MVFGLLQDTFLLAVGEREFLHFLAPQLPIAQCSVVHVAITEYLNEDTTQKEPFTYF